MENVVMGSENPGLKSGDAGGKGVEY